MVTAAEHLSPLAQSPEWGDLARFQKTITRADFLKLLDAVYAPEGAWKQCIKITPEAAVIHAPESPAEEFRLEFAPSTAAAKPLLRYWKAAGGGAASAAKPLAGYTVALDPGHLGGKWAKMEERWFQIGNAKPVTEGDMALVVAHLLDARLAALGAKVVYVRGSSDPVTSERPQDLRSAAEAELRRQGIAHPRDGYNGAADPLKFNSVTWESELLFYRISEIRHRAERVNDRLKPDLVICLHFNAEDWGDPAKPSLTDKNHMHLLVNGNYWPGELGFADIRHEMLLKLLNRTARDEVPLAGKVAAALSTATGLPAFEYHGGKARRVSTSPYVWSRNLLANRLYDCPVVYTEPYVMNSKSVFDRVQLGDYEGLKPVEGVLRKSIYREYADAVAEGVADFYRSKLPKASMASYGEGTQ